jgi:hypothetical protein
LVPFYQENLTVFGACRLGSFAKTVSGAGGTMMHLFSVHGEQSRELLKKLDDRHDASPQLTLAQVGLGQSRGYLQVREIPDGSPERRWCVLKDERLWFFDAPDSSKAGTSLLLELAVRTPVCLGAACTARPQRACSAAKAPRRC